MADVHLALQINPHVPIVASKQDYKVQLLRPKSKGVTSVM